MITKNTRQRRGQILLDTVKVNQNRSNECLLEVGRALIEIKRDRYYILYGYSTFQAFVDSLGIKRRRAQYLMAIVSGAKKVGISTETIIELGLFKARYIFSLNAETHRSKILSLINKANKMSVEEVKAAVTTAANRDARVHLKLALTVEQHQVFKQALRHVDPKDELPLSTAVAEMSRQYLGLQSLRRFKRAA